MTHAIEKLPKLTRRALLQVTSVAAGAVSILGLSARSAKAALQGIGHAYMARSRRCGVSPTGQEICCVHYLAM